MGVVRGVVLHSTRSGTPNNPTEGIGTVNYCATPGTTSYNFVLDVDGTIYELVPPGVAAWHAGYLNWTHLGIAVAQGTIDDRITDEQHTSLEWLLRKYTAYYGIPYQRVLDEKEPGIIQHADAAQGKAYGKTDPGYRLNWQRLGL